MNIKSIAVQNFRCFEHLRADFLSGMNVIAGINGAGKTSLLAAVAAALLPMARDLQVRVRHPLLSDAARRLRQDDKGRQRFEAQFPCECRCSLERDGRKWELGAMLRSAVDGTASLQGEVVDFQKALPLLAFYRVNRQWSAESMMAAAEAAENQEARRDGYVDWDDAGCSEQALKRWLIVKSIERLQAAVVRQTDFWSVEDDELAEVNRALRQALPGEFEHIFYDLAAKSVLVKLSGKTMEFSSLSEGQRAFIGLFADITRRLCLLRPDLGDKVIAEADGIVLIDEIDLHLHPSWQRRMVKGLSVAFPKLQFIVTTHSPQVLSEVEASRVLLLKDGRLVRPSQSWGFTSDEVLRKIMQTTDCPDVVSETVEAVYADIEAERYEDARERLEALEKQTAGPTEETLQLGALLTSLSGEAEGQDDAVD